MINKKIMVVALILACLLTMSAVNAAENENGNISVDEVGDGQVAETPIEDVTLGESQENVLQGNPEGVNVEFFGEKFEFETDDNATVMMIYWPENMPDNIPVTVDSNGSTNYFYHEGDDVYTIVHLKDMNFKEPGDYNLWVYCNGTDLASQTITVIETLRPIDFIELYEKTISYDDEDEFISIVHDGYNGGDGLEGNVSLFANGNLVYTEMFYGTGFMEIIIQQNWIIPSLVGKNYVTVKYSRYDGRVFELSEWITVLLPDGTFTDLANEIDAVEEGGTLTLNRDYVYNEGHSNEGIGISKAITIDGQGHTINANQSSKIFSINCDNVVLKNIRFANATYIGTTTTGDEGGAVSGGTSVNCTFELNTANYGGAIAHGSAINCTFISNSANSEGGAIYYGNATNCRFYSNTADSGGAIKSGNAMNCNFTNNFVSGYGGAIYDGDATGCTFINNSAVTNAGALDMGTAINCTFINNSADYGGAMCGNAENSVFINNTARENGGAMYWASSVNCTFTGNTAGFSGGAIYDGVARYSNFTNNSAVEGGAIGNGDAYNCIFISNYATDSGGAIFVERINGSVFRSTFIDCHAENMGGGIFFYAENCSMIDAFFENNTAEEGPDWYSVHNLTVKMSTKLIVSQIRTTYGIPGNLVVTLIDLYNRNLSGKDIAVLLNGKYYYGVTGYDGQTSFTLPDNLKPGTYTANISYAGDSMFYPISMTVPVIVEKADTALSVHYDYDSNEMVATLTSNATGQAIKGYTLTVKLHGETYRLVTDAAGQVRVSGADLVPGTVYTVSVKFNGGTKYNAAKLTEKVPVVANTTIDAVYSDDTKEFIATLTNNATGQAIKGFTLRVDLNGKNYKLVTDAWGQVVISTAGFDYGTYPATVTFKGSTKYNPSNATFDVVVNKIQTSIDATYDAENNQIVAILINDDVGVSIKGGTVGFVINGVKTLVTTDANGQSVLSLEGYDLTSFKVSVSYGGNAKYFGSVRVVFGEVNKTATFISVVYDSQNDEVIARVTNEDTNQLIKGATVGIEINGVKNIVKTDTNGFAKVSVADLGPGAYTVTASYSGNTKYSGTSETVTIVKSA